MQRQAIERQNQAQRQSFEPQLQQQNPIMQSESEQMPAGQIQSAPNAVANLTPEENAIFENYSNLSPQDKKLASSRLIQIRKEKLAAAKEDKERQVEDKRLAYAETKPFREFISKERTAYQKNDSLIKNMTRLSATGKLTNPKAYSLLKKVGMDIPALLSEESQEYLKFQQAYLTNAKDIFGSQISAFEIAEYLKGIPTLENTKEGKERIFKNQLIENEGRKALIDAADEIIKENGGSPPIDLETKARERAQPKIASLAESFKENSQIPKARSLIPGKNKASSQARPGYVIMTDEKGQPQQVLQSDVQEARAAGWQ
jgi:hypothetical protein